MQGDIRRKKDLYLVIKQEANIIPEEGAVI